MHIEVLPVDIACNLRCEYCYQEKQRAANNYDSSYNLDTIKSKLAGTKDAITLFGGEPLLMPEDDLEELFAWGFERAGRSSIQTNATLINDRHVEMFKQYRVSVGVSIDGPGSLNDPRGCGSVSATRQMTQKTHDNIARLLSEGIPVSLIITLHRANSSKERLPEMLDWLRHCDEAGIISARLHLLEVDTTTAAEKLALTTEEYITALTSYYELQKTLYALRFDIFKDMMALLMGQDQESTCCWRSCDPYNTESVFGVDGHGQIGNCHRSSKDGISYLKADARGYQRTIVLYHTPQEYGGCKDCRFFLMCRGHCPGTAIEGDWRNRTLDCEVWKFLFEYLEHELVDWGELPVSLRSDREDLEELLLRRVKNGNDCPIHRLLEMSKEELKERSALKVLGIPV